MQQLQASLKEIMMQRPLIAAMLAVLSGGMPVLAQVSRIGSPSPSIGATSPLGTVPGSPVLPTAIHGFHGAFVARTQSASRWPNRGDWR
jgi:hypothetical protein